VDVTRSQGLDLIPPLVFKASLERLYRELQKAGKVQPSKLRQKLEVFERYVGLSLFKSSNKKIREEAEKASKEGSAVHKAIALMQTALDSPEAERLFHETEVE
jgi:hypothetical protein